MIYSIIVAIAQNGAIGKNNDLLWHLSEDLKYFKKTTSGKTVIMGYNTWLSLPLKPLPKRRNVVLVPDNSFDNPDFEAAYSIEDVGKICQNDDECFIIGGGMVYRQFLPLADRLYITWVYKDFDADIFFPEIDFSQWKEVSLSERQHDEVENLDFAYSVYERIRQW
jgi:dihydrofolate reductase